MATGGDEKHDNKFIQINIYRLKHFFAPMHTEHVRQKHKKWAKLEHEGLQRNAMGWVAIGVGCENGTVVDG